MDNKIHVPNHQPVSIPLHRVYVNLPGDMICNSIYLYYYYYIYTYVYIQVIQVLTKLLWNV